MVEQLPWVLHWRGTRDRLSSRPFNSSYNTLRTPSFGSPSDGAVFWVAPILFRNLSMMLTIVYASWSHLRAPREQEG